VLSDVASGRIKVLFVSPERLSNPHLLEALRPRMPLPLVVIDEAHCVAGELAVTVAKATCRCCVLSTCAKRSEPSFASMIPLLCLFAAEWGHSFRPAYFRLGVALANNLQAHRILALTATATRITEAAIQEVSSQYASTTGMTESPNLISI
jgi:ATP-dependent DNA helicase Q4